MIFSLMFGIENPHIIRIEQARVSRNPFAPELARLKFLTPLRVKCKDEIRFPTDRFYSFSTSR